MHWNEREGREREREGGGMISVGRKEGDEKGGKGREKEAYGDVVQ